MNSYNYSYNVLINRLEAFAAGHLLIKRFTHGQIDLADMDQDEQYPFMHVVPNNIRPVDGGIQFDFQIIFADIPRDKEVKAEYQREVISDCVRLAQDLIAEVKNGLALFGFDVQLVTPPVIEPFMEEYKNTLTGVTFSLQLEVPWDWSACDIPAVWAVGGTSTGGAGSPIGIVLRTNGVDNAVQSILDLVAGTNITITDNGDGSVTFDAAGGGGPQIYVSTEFNANHATAFGNQYVIGDRVWYNGSVYACIANNDGINPTNPSYWTLQAVGYRLRQTPVDWNASSGDYQILNKPTLATVATTGDYNDLINTPSIPSGTVTSVGLTVPSPANPAFTVTGSPITSSGTLAIGANGTASQYVDGTGALRTMPTGLPPTGAAGGDLQGTYPNPTVHQIHGIEMQSGTPTAGDVWLYEGAPAKWQHQPLPASHVTNDSSVTGSKVKDALNHLSTTKVEANAAITGATATKITYDSKGLITAGTTLAATDIPSGINAANIGTGVVSNTEFGYLDGVTSAIQTQINAKQDTLVSSTNIKTVNSTSLLGSGNVSVGTVTSVGGTGTVAGISLSGTVTGSGNLTLGGTLSTPVNTISDSTTVGQNLVTLPNPSAIRYLRVNADNSVSALSASQLITDLGIINNIQLFKDFSVYSVVNTSTNTLFQTYAIAANSLQVNDFIELFAHFNSTQASGTLTYRLYINTAANLTGATLLATMSPSLPTGNVYEFSRQIAVTAIGTSGNFRLPNVSGNIIAGGNLSVTTSNVTVNTTVIQYLMFAAQMSVTTATTTQQMVFARINR